MPKQYIVAERAHFMCPNMHFGILMQMNCQYDDIKARKTLCLLAKAHPFLRSVIALDPNEEKLYYSVCEQSKIEINVKNDFSALWNDYSEIGRKSWNVFENGLLKVFLYPEKDKFQVLLIAHHLLADGRSLLSLACEFANSYVNGVVPNFVEESLIQNIYDLPLGTGLSFISKRVEGQANKQWQKESRKVIYDEYMHFANNFAHENPTSHERVILIEDDTDTIIKLCKDNDISVNDYLLAGLFDVAKPKNIIVAVDIRNKLACYQEGALGNYASALSVFCKEKSDDVFKQAKAIHQQIQLSLNDNKKLMAILACYLSMQPTLIDAAAIASMGGFDSKSGRFVGETILGYKKRDGISITNLGSVECEAMHYAMFIPPASPATIHTIDALTVNGTMQLCSSYYSNAITESTVKKHLDSFIVSREYGPPLSWRHTPPQEPAGTDK